MEISLNKTYEPPFRKKPTSCWLFFVVSCLTLCLTLISACKTEKAVSVTPNPTYLKVKGKTMGTHYNITYKPYLAPIPQAKLDSILVDINLAVSTYIDTSVISKINNSSKYGKPVEILVNGSYHNTHKIKLPYNEHFDANFKLAQYLNLQTDGFFEPTVMPLVNYWGFGYEPKVAVTKVDSLKVHKLLQQVGMDNFTLEASEQEMICIKPPAAELDFSASAKGYAVDYLSTYLKDQGVENLMVEIGGEVYAKGLNPSGRAWTIGINLPDENSSITESISYLKLDGYALASSGNYRNFHEVDGKKYGHELNPFTGFPEFNELLSVSVIAPTCGDADAYATALMVMGKEKALKFAELKHELEAILYYGNEEGELDFVFTSGYFSHKFLPEAVEQVTAQ